MNDELNGRKLLANRTKAFALAIIRTYSRLGRDNVAQVLGKQLLRSGTSVGAHYREAMRSRSTAEFVSKLEGGLQELEETAYWLELLAEAGVVEHNVLVPIQREAGELNAMLTASVRTTKARRGDK